MSRTFVDKCCSIRCSVSKPSEINPRQQMRQGQDKYRKIQIRIIQVNTFLNQFLSNMYLSYVQMYQSIALAQQHANSKLNFESNLLLLGVATILWCVELLLVVQCSKSIRYEVRIAALEGTVFQNRPSLNSLLKKIRYSAKLDSFKKHFLFNFQTLVCQNFTLVFYLSLLTCYP